jgi:aminoglycoside phosphotransferase (APT) family kinase protein
VRMHADELPIDDALVRRLVAAQFPEWAALPLEPVRYFGTDNAIYRLGDELAVRLPRREHNVLGLRKELRWLPELAPLLPLAVPEPVATGEPGEGYPLEWAVYRWLPGEPAYESPPEDPRPELVALLAAFWAIDPAGGPAPRRHSASRGGPLAPADGVVRQKIAEAGLGRKALEVWEAALAAGEWKGEPVWLHGDLDVRNLLVTGRRLSGVVDFGTLGVGDPAADVMVAWKMLTPAAREEFRRELEIDDATWARSRASVLAQSVNALTYYTDENNPILVREARAWLAEVLAESPA